MTKYQIAEVLVFRQQKAVLRLRPHHNVCVARCRRNFRHVDNVVTGNAQLRHQSGVNTFIGKPAQG